MGFSIQVYIVIIPVVLALIWYLKYLWENRDLFIKSWNYPGPFNLPVIGAGYLFLGRAENVLSSLVKLQQKYPNGAKLWFANRLIYYFEDPENIQKVLGTTKMVEKDKFYNRIVNFLGEGLLQSPVPIWKKHRKAIGPSFGQKVLDSFVEVFTYKSKILVQILENDHVGKKNVDMQQLLSRCTLDILCETALGLKLKIQTEDVDHAENFDKLMWLIFINIFHIWNHVGLVWKLLGYEKKAKECVAKLNALSEKVIQDRIKLLESSKDINSSDQVLPDTPNSNTRTALLDYVMQNGTFTATELRDEVNVFLMAGTDTTASTLNFLFAVLGIFQDVQQKIYEEIIEVIGEDDDPEPFHLPRMVYTERVIKETLRLFPVGGYFLRTVTEDIDIGKFTVPKGAAALFCIVGIHRNPKYWPDPLKFDPDRFLPEEVAKRHPCCYLPFSFGPRNCIGRVYGMMNMKVIIATVIRKFRIYSEHKSIEDIKLMSNIVLRFKEGPKLSLSLRKGKKV